MVDLETLSGLPLKLDGAGQLSFGLDVVVEETKARLLDELTPVAMEPETCRGSREVAYTMYNGVYRQRDAARLAGVPMRYELTLFPALRMGREFVKTLGHLHAAEPKSGIDYPEVCEVLAGTAHFFFQTLDPDGPSASAAFYVEVGPGEKLVIPPGFDHLTINPGPGPLLFSDVIALGVSGIYDRFKAAFGAAYFEIAENGQPRFVPNPAYRGVPPLEKRTPKGYPALRLTRDEPLYSAFVGTRGEKWPFLADPIRFWPAFPDLEAELSSLRRQ
jgi:glucose-6-phosphate isomerase